MPTGDRPDPPNRTIRLQISGSFDTARWANIMWLFATGSGEIVHADLVAVCNLVFGAYTDQFLPLLSNALLLEQVQAALYNDGDQIVAYSSAGVAQGGVSGVAMPAQVAACISWPISARYRGGHPRSYLCGIPVAKIANPTTFDGDFLSAAVNSANDFHSTIEDSPAIGDGIATLEHGVVSFVDAGAWRAPPLFRRIQDGASVDSRIDTQRRRLGPDR